MTKKVSNNTTGAARLPRGIRNNNPLNIRRSKSKWMGKVENPTDPEFEQFSHITFGIRAALILITKYVKNYRIRTLYGIVHRWAPDGDGGNNELEYYKALVQYGVNSPVQETKSWLFSLVHAMCLVESNYYLSEKEFNDAFVLCSKARDFWRYF